MSDPVANVDIEDVLSSIRRLVTEEIRGGGRKAPARGEEAPARLVLTPALRVAPAEEAPPGETLRAEFGRISEPDEIEFRGRMRPKPQVVVSESEPWRDPRATLHAAAARAVEGVAEAEPEFGPEPEPVSEPETLAPEAVEAEVAQVPDGDDVIEDVWQEPAGADSAPQEALPVAEPEEAVDEESDSGAFAPEAEELPEVAFEAEPESEPEMVAEPEPEFGPEPDMVAEPEPEPVMAARFEQEEAGERLGTVAERVVTASKRAEMNQRELTLSAKIKALEAAIAETPGQWEPDGSSADEYAGTPADTVPWRDHVPPKPAAEQPAPVSPAWSGAKWDKPEPEAVEPAASEVSSEETLLDEESLRELVAEIVRQELQGALGERITRNVRKLVRREIHRALTAQQLE